MHMLQFSANLPQFAANLPKFAASLPQFAANLPSGRMFPPYREGPDPALLLATCPSPPAEGWGQQWGSRMISCSSHHTMPARLPPRVDGLWLAGEPPALSTLPANMVRNLAPTWAATCAGSSDSSPSIFDFMLLYDNCVATGLAARVSVNHITSYQDVTLFCCFPTRTTAANVRKRRRRCQRCPSATVTACPSPVLASRRPSLSRVPIAHLTTCKTDQETSV
jgi:hypothetical protein